MPPFTHLLDKDMTLVMLQVAKVGEEGGLFYDEAQPERQMLGYVSIVPSMTSAFVDKIKSLPYLVSVGFPSKQDAGSVPRYQVCVCELLPRFMTDLLYIELPQERLLEFFFDVEHLAGSFGRKNMSFRLLDVSDHDDIIGQYGRSRWLPTSR